MHHTITVKDESRSKWNKLSLNELEFVNGEIWAVEYKEDSIAPVNPETGDVLGYINLSGIHEQLTAGANFRYSNPALLDYKTCCSRIFNLYVG